MNELSTVKTISSLDLLMDESSMHRLERVADLMASGKSTVPVHLRGNKGDCFAVAMQSMQWGMNPFAVAQKTHLINGVLGYESQLVSAVINNSGAVKDRFNFEWFGAWEKIIGKFKEVESKTKKDDNGFFKKYIVPAWQQSDENGLGVRVWATIKGEAQPRFLELLLTQARTRNSTLWTEDPKQQLAYLAQKRWARLYAPDVILGVYSPDEFEQPGEIHMGQADVVGGNGDDHGSTGRPALEPYDEAKFQRNLGGAWAKRVQEGGNPEDLIAILQTRNTLTENQVKAIRDLAITDVPDPETSEVAPPATASKNEAGGGFTEEHADFLAGLE